MSQKLPNMLENTIQKIREMVDVNSVIGQPITTPDGVTIIPISKVSVGFGGGGSDYVSRNANKQDNPFGGGAGGGVAYDADTLAKIANNGLTLSPITQVLIEKYIYGWKEIEFETMRDSAGNAIAICSMENFDPVGVHTGDSIVVAPALTLSTKEYSKSGCSVTAMLPGIVQGVVVQAKK